MKPGYSIEQYGESNPSIIFCYNWHFLGTVGLACYPKLSSKQRKDIPKENLVAIFKIKTKCSAKKSS